MYQIAVRLNELNIPTKKGCKWPPVTVRNLLKNPAYTGVQFYGVNRYRKVKGGKREVTKRPPSEVIPIDGFSPPIISQELFDLVQNRIASRQAKKTRAKHRYLLTGHTKCTTCGSPVVGACLSGSYRYYRCRATVPTSAGPASCRSRYIRAEDLEEYVFGKVIEAVSNPAVIVAELEDVIVGGAGDTSQEMNQLKREIRDLEGQQIRLIQQRSKDVIDQELLERQIGPVKALCDEKRQSLRVLEEQQRVRDSKWERESRVHWLCQQLAVKLESLDFDEKRALLGAFAVEVKASRDEADIKLVLDPKFTTIEQTLGCLLSKSVAWGSQRLQCIPFERELV